MKNKIEHLRTRAPVVILLLSFTAGLSHAAIEFSGYTQAGPEMKFVLVDSGTQQSSGWLEMGGAFRGYTLVAYDRKGEVLSVRKDDMTLQLPLRSSRAGAVTDLSTASVARRVA